MPIDEKAWAGLMSGENCPFCSGLEADNPYSIKVAELSISTLWLEKDQRFRGYCILIFNRHATELTELTPAEVLAYHADLLRAARAIELALHPDKMNYCLLGNTVPHLHWHLTPRYKDDPRWNQPHWADWDRREEVVLRLSPAEYRRLVQRIQDHLDCNGG